MNKREQKEICLIEGDGIGPELMFEAERILDALDVCFTYTRGEAGYGAYQQHGTPLPAQTLAAARSANAILFAAVTTPPKIEGYFSPIVRLRSLLNLYANVRPCFSLPVANSPQWKNVDLVIVRENTEDLYVGDETSDGETAMAKRVITRHACARIVEFAFRLAQSQGRQRVTAVHKANILRLTDGLFYSVAAHIAKQFPRIDYDAALVDSFGYNLVSNPQAFDVVVTTNMFGDILSDVAAALVGGLGVVASANINDQAGLFEPVHGSAPDIAGHGVANPVAMFFAIVMMLEFLDECNEARRLKLAIMATIEAVHTTPDLGGNCRTSEVTDFVLRNLDNTAIGQNTATHSNIGYRSTH